MMACACTSIVLTRLPLITVCLRWPPACGAAASLVALQPWNTIESALPPVFLVFIHILLVETSMITAVGRSIACRQDRSAPELHSPNILMRTPQRRRQDHAIP